MGTRTLSSVIAAIALGVVAVWPAHAEVPTATDFAACNTKAAEEAASDSPSASPKTARPGRGSNLPPDVRRGPSVGSPRGDVEMPPSPSGKAGATGVPKDPTGNTLSSDKDPQVDGMAADRANDPVYVAAYRSCMRQRGF